MINRTLIKKGLEVYTDEWEKVKVLYVGEDLLVYRHIGEFESRAENSERLDYVIVNWHESTTPSHGDEDIARTTSSSSIYRASYVEKKELLFITFHSNSKKTYVYSDVALATWRDMTAADSMGRFYMEYIRDTYDRFVIYPGIISGDETCKKKNAY